MLKFETYAHVGDLVEVSLALPDGRQLVVKGNSHTTSDPDEIWALSNHPAFKRAVEVSEKDAADDEGEES